MVAFLQIGMSCMARMLDQRPKIREMVRMVEEIRTGNTPSAGTRSPGSTPLTPHVTEIGSSSHNH